MNIFSAGDMEESVLGVRRRDEILIRDNKLGALYVELLNEVQKNLEAQRKERRESLRIALENPLCFDGQSVISEQEMRVLQARLESLLVSGSPHKVRRISHMSALDGDVSG